MSTTPAGDFRQHILPPFPPVTDTEYTLRWPEGEEVFSGELCPVGAAARLRRMERIAKKYLRRAENSMEAATEGVFRVCGTAESLGWNDDLRRRNASYADSRAEALYRMEILSDILSA